MMKMIGFYSVEFFDRFVILSSGMSIFPFEVPSESNLISL